MDRRGSSVTRTVAIFVVLGVLVLGLVAGAGFLVIRRIAVERALEGARELTAFSSEVVQKRVSNGLVKGDAVATGEVARIVGDSVLHEPIVQVKLWGPDGTILYSTEPRVIGKRFESGAQELAELADGQVSAEVSDLSAPENE